MEDIPSGYYRHDKRPDLHGVNRSLSDAFHGSRHMQADLPPTFRP